MHVIEIINLQRGIWILTKKMSDFFYFYVNFFVNKKRSTVIF